MRSDNEFYSREDEYSQIQHIDEFHREGDEYYSELKYTVTNEKKKSNRRKIDRISKIVVATSCVVVTAASVHISHPDAGPVVDTVSIETVESRASDQLPVIEETTEVAEISTVAEEILTLSENQKKFITEAWAAFEDDDIDTLENLLNEEAFSELSDEEFQGKVFTTEERESYRNRDSFSGKGLLLHKWDDENMWLACVDLVNGETNGEGKKISLDKDHEVEDGVETRIYYTGNWVQNVVEGEGAVYCRHRNSSRNQYDSADGIFQDGWLVEGTASISYVAEGGDYPEKVESEQTIIGREVVFRRTTYTDLITGEVSTSERQDISKADHFYIGHIN